MKANLPLDEVYTDWIRMVEHHQLTDWTLPLLDFLYATRGIALPLLWMVAPLMPTRDLQPLEKALEDPDILLRVRDQLIDHEVHT